MPAPQAVPKGINTDSEIIPQLLDKYSADGDFNDQYYKMLCERAELILVTHDGDFYVGGIEVVTANQKTLRKYEDMKRKKAGR